MSEPAYLGGLALPNPSLANAGKAVKVNGAGTGYEVGDVGGGAPTFPLLTYEDVASGPGVGVFRHEGFVLPADFATHFPVWEQVGGAPTYTHTPIFGRDLVATQYQGLHDVEFYANCDDAAARGVQFTLGNPLGGRAAIFRARPNATATGADDPTQAEAHWRGVMPLWGLPAGNELIGDLMLAALQVAILGKGTYPATTWNIYLNVNRVLVDDGTYLAAP